MHDANTLTSERLLSEIEGLRKLARLLVADSQTADDVVQDACVAALERGDSVRKNPRGWLRAVTRNVAFNERRSASRRRGRERECAVPEAMPSAAEVAERLDTRRSLVDAVEALPPPYRAVIYLRFFENVSASEIARRLDVPVETVRTRIKRGLRRLRVSLDTRHGRAWHLALAPVGLGLPSISKLGVLAVKKHAVVLALVLIVILAGWLVLGPRPGSNEPPHETGDLDALSGKPVSVAPAGAPEPDATPVLERGPVDTTEEAPVQPEVVVAAAGGTVRGRVVDAETGDGLAGVEVSLVRREIVIDDAHGAPLRTTTATDGSYRLSDVPPGRSTLVVRSATHFVPSFATQRPVFAAAAFGPGAPQIASRTPPALTVRMRKSFGTVIRDVRLSRGIAIRGRVVGPDGEPVAGALVTAAPVDLWPTRDPWAAPEAALGGLPAKSGTDGTFEIGGLPPRHAWTLRASKKGLIGVPSKRVRTRTGRPTPEVTLQLVAAAVVSGVVVDEKDEPMAAVPVLLLGLNPARPLEQQRTVTNAEGLFRFEAAAGSPRPFLTAKPAGHPGESLRLQPLEPGEKRPGLRITIQTGLVVSGTLFDSDRKPIPHQTIQLSKADAARAGPRMIMDASQSLLTRTDAAGRFRFTGVPSGRLRLTVPRGPLVPGVELMRPFQAPAEELEVTWNGARDLVLRGTVLAPDGHPVPHATLQWQPVRRNRVPGQFFSATSPDMTVSVEDGTFAIPVGQKGPYRIDVSDPRDADGFLINAVPVQMRVDDVSDPVTVRLREGKVIRGRVLDAKGEGLGGIAVQGLGVIVWTRDDGRFELNGLSDGDASLLVIAPMGYLELNATNVAAGTDDYTVTLYASVELSGTATHEGKPAAGGRVQVEWPTDGTIPGGIRAASVDTEGSFVIEGVPAGKPLRVTARYFPQGSVPPPEVVHEDVLAESGDLAITFGGGVLITGTIVDARGVPLAGLYARATPVSGDGMPATGVPATDESGTFRIRVSRAGSYRMSVHRSPFGLVFDGDVISAPVADLRIVVPDKGVIEGVVQGAVDDLRRYVVRAFPNDEPTTLAGTSGVTAEGAFSLADLQPGRTYDLSVTLGFGAGGKLAYRKNVELGARELTLTLVDGMTISGVVETSAGKPLAFSKSNAWVYASSDGWSQGAPIDEQGRFVIQRLLPGSYVLSVGVEGSSEPLVRQSGVAAGAEGVRLVTP